MKTIALILVLVTAGCARQDAPSKPTVRTAAPPAITVGDYYSPIQPDDPFKHRDWHVKVTGVAKGFVEYELVDKEFRPTDHVKDSVAEVDFRIQFPGKISR